MSITLDYEDITYVIYKHLLECGYVHSAFCLEQEAKLSSTKMKEKMIPPGYLVHSIEKSLVLSRMETHVHLDELHECDLPYDFLEDHTCEIVNKIIDKREACFKEIIKENIVVSLLLHKTKFFVLL